MIKCVNITLIHGTFFFSRTAAWTAKASPFCNSIVEGLNVDVTFERLKHLGGQRRAFYQLRENLEQSGDVTAPATTDAIWLVEEVVAVAQRLSAYWSIA
jgi:hypothetical protein